ncbi:MAG: HNH endonuclease [Chloroflexota bacterium]|nr:HNH endonuclease [Chloroflexota bacterium]
MGMPRKPRRACGAYSKQVSRPEKVFCNNVCQQIYAWRAYIARWQVGEVTGNKIDGDVSDHVRRYLYEKYGERCSQCGWADRNPATGRVPICVDHIDGDWRNTTENNLRLLCPNCHSLTSTYQALNKGKGRPWRYKKVRDTEYTAR